MRLQHVVSGDRPSPSAVIYHACAGSRTGLHLHLRREGETSHLSLDITENFIHLLRLTWRGCPGPSAGSGHFQSDTLRFFYWRLLQTPVELAKKQTNNQKNPPKKLHVKRSPEIYDAEEIGVKDKYVFIIICIGFYLCVIIENHPVGRTNHRW